MMGASHYWRAKVFTKATIKYGYPSERRQLLQTKAIKTRSSHGHQKGQRWYGYRRTEMLKIDHAHHHLHAHNAIEQNHKNLPRED